MDASSAVQPGRRRLGPLLASGLFGFLTLLFGGAAVEAAVTVSATTYGIEMPLAFAVLSLAFAVATVFVWLRFNWPRGSSSSGSHESASAPNDPILAAGQVGFRHRFGAYAIDFVVISLLISSAQSAFSLLRDASPAPFWILYLVYFTAGYALGATAGMLAVGLRLIGPNGERIGVRTALLRTLCVLLVSLAAFSLIGGAAFIANRLRRRPFWHERATRSYVVRKASLTSFATVSRLERSLPVEPREDRLEYGAQARDREMKKCPECAELVLSEARICRYCRHEFVPRVA
jgi:uncharacterized RDD family membrane protein YckC